MQWVQNGSRLGYRAFNAVGMEWVTPGLPSIQCSGYGMGHAWITEHSMQWVWNGSCLDYRAFNAVGMNGSCLDYRALNAVGTEWVMPVLLSNECSGYGMGHAWVNDHSMQWVRNRLRLGYRGCIFPETKKDVTKLIDCCSDSCPFKD